MAAAVLKLWPLRAAWELLRELWELWELGEHCCGSCGSTGHLRAALGRGGLELNRSVLELGK